MSKFKKGIDKFFLEEENPYTQKKSVKFMNLGLAVACMLVMAVLLSGLWEQSKDLPKDLATKSLEQESSQRRGSVSLNTSQTDSLDYTSAYKDYRTPSKRVNAPTRKYQASQIIQSQKGASGLFLPLGSVLKVKLLNQVNSSDKDSPVIAVVSEQISREGEIVVPVGSRFIGKGGLNNYSERFCIQFNALVFPDGSEHDLKGTAVMPDGSSCISGKYNSGNLRKHSSQFLGDFASGLAEGLKTKEVNDKGIPFDKGGLKNGLLNGFGKSSSNWTRSTASQYGNTRPKVTINTGSVFLIFLQERLQL